MANSRLKKATSATAPADWVMRAQGGDSDALAQLVSATKDRLYRFVLFLGADRALAQDVCQDTYLYAIEHVKELREPAAFWGWLLRIARHRFLDIRKSPRHSAHAPLEVAEAAKASGDPELISEVAIALGRLEEDDRAALLLVDLEGLTYAEAAKALGVSESAMTSRVYRARERFHTLFFKA